MRVTLSIKWKVAIGVSLACLLWVKSAYLRGVLAAHRDIRHQHLRIYADGAIGPERVIYKPLLWERYGIEDLHRIDCVDIWTCESEAFLTGYDDAMNAAIEKKFGKDILHRTHAEAMHQWMLAEPDRAKELCADLPEAC
jgi:hypothetical protein